MYLELSSTGNHSLYFRTKAGRHRLILSLVMLPVIGAAIGWLTNVIAIKMIFWPRNPIRLPLLPVTIQGLLPRRKRELAVSVGNTIEQELLSVDDLLSQLDDPEFRERMLNGMKVYVTRRTEEIIPGFLPNGMRAGLISLASEFIHKESGRFLDDIAGRLKSEVKSRIDFSELVEQRINGLDLDRLEEIVVGIAHKELRAIEVLGGLLGFLIGLGQAAFLYSMLH